MKMISPFKLFEGELNFYKLDHNETLGNELREFFSQTNNNYLWKISEGRQKITHALRYTENIPLRHLKNVPKHYGTIESNQLMEVTSSKLIKIPLMEKTICWVESTLKKTGANNIEFGRIFVSKLAPYSVVDLHTDEGKYFSYYDRFHFTVTAADENYFIINNENCILKQDSLYWVDNHVPHWLENKSSDARINFIIDARLS